MHRPTSQRNLHIVVVVVCLKAAAGPFFATPDNSAPIICPY